MNDNGGLGTLDRARMTDLGVLAGRVRADLFVLTTAEGSLEVWVTDHNESVVLAFSKVSLLVTSCGNGQPYVRMSQRELQDSIPEQGPMFVALDVWHPAGARYPEPDVRAMAFLPELDDGPARAAVLWVPSQPARSRDQRVDLELRRDGEGRAMVLAYSSIDELRAGCGPYQAAVAIEAHRIHQVAREAGAAGVVLNVPLAEQTRHTRPVRPGRTKTHPDEGQQNRGRTVGRSAAKRRRQQAD